MIPSGARLFLTAGAVDFRKGPDGLVGLVRDAGVDPFNGALFVFRSKRADRIKIVWFDGPGDCVCSPSIWNIRISSGRRLGAPR